MNVSIESLLADAKLLVTRLKVSISDYYLDLAVCIHIKARASIQRYCVLQKC